MSGVATNLSRVATAILLFHHKFYHELFLACWQGFAFLAYLVYPFPKDFLHFVRNFRSSSTVGGIGLSFGAFFVDLFTAAPKIGLMAFARLNTFVNTLVQKMNGLVKKASVPTDDAAEATDVDLKASKESTVSKSERSPPKKSSVAKTPPKDDYGDDHSVPRNPRVADRLEDGENTESPTVRRKNTLKNILRPELEMLERETPPRNLEAFRSQVVFLLLQDINYVRIHSISQKKFDKVTIYYIKDLQVRIGEEILAIPKDEAKELFAKQTIVSGPWLKEEEGGERQLRQKFVPKYPSSRDHRYLSSSWKPL